MNLLLAIEQWDGKSAKVIGDIYNRYCLDEQFSADIINAMSNDSQQKGATWLLKHHLESGNKIEARAVGQVFKQLMALGSWESKLHILQCLPYLLITKSHKNKVELFLRECLMDSNKFVRAWAYNGFYELSVQYTEYREETQQIFEMAMRDEAPSVKSRIRNIMKKGF